MTHQILHCLVNGVQIIHRLFYVRDLGVGPKRDINCATRTKMPPLCTFLQHRLNNDSEEQRARFRVKSSFKLPSLNENLIGWTLLGKAL